MLLIARQLLFYGYMMQIEGKYAYSHDKQKMPNSNYKTHILHANLAVGIKGIGAAYNLSLILEVLENVVRKLELVRFSLTL